MIRTISRIVLLLLVARMAAVVPTRRMGRIDQFSTTRVLLRYCVCPGSLQLSSSIDPSSDGDGAGGAEKTAFATGVSFGGPILLESSPAFLSIPAFVTRPPSHLRC